MAIVLSSSASSGAQVQTEGAAAVLAQNPNALVMGSPALETQIQHQPTGQTPATTVRIPGAGLSLPGQPTLIPSGEAVKLSTGEYVSKAEYDKLSAADQALLMQLGIDKFNAQKQTDLQNFLNNNVKLSTGEYISKVDFAKLSLADQQLLMSLGIAKFNEQKQAAYNAFASQNTQLPNGEWIPNYFYNDLTTDALNALRTGGTAAFNQWLVGKNPVDVFKDGGWKPDFTQPNPYAGMPFWYQAWESANFIPTPSNPNPPSAGYTGGTGTPPTVVTTVGVSALPGAGVTSFKPDFTKSNPYEGAPLSYFQLEISGYVPTATNPLPPSLTYLQANPQAQLVQATPTLTPQPFTQSEYVIYQMATPDQKFNTLMAKGYIPKGSQYAGLDDQGQLLFLSPENVLRNQLVNLWAKRAEELSATYTTQLKDFESNLAKAPKELQDAYKSGGIEGYRTAETAYNAKLADAKAALDPYRVTLQGPFITESGAIQAGYKTDNYDVPKYLADNQYSAASIKYLKDFGISDTAISALVTLHGDSPEAFLRKNPNADSVKVLKDAGYEQGVLDAANKYLADTQKATDEINSVLARTKPDTGALLSAIQEAGYYKVGVGATSSRVITGADGSSTVIWFGADGRALTDTDLAAAQWKALDEAQKAEVAGIFGQDKYRGNYFAEYVKEASKASAEGGIVGGLVFGGILPVLEPLAKTSTGQPVSAMEWTVGGLVGALDLLMVGGGEALGALGYGGKMTASALSHVVPVTLGVVQAPAVAAEMRNPTVSIGQKIVSGVSEGLLIGVPLAGATIRGVKFADIATRDNYVPLRSMSMEAQTARGYFTEEQLATMRKAGVTDADILAAGTKLNEQLVAGAKIAEVNLGGVKFTVKNVPYQTEVGLSLFQSTPDITVFDRGGEVPIFKEFYTAGKVAIEPLERSYITGQRAVHPGIVEIKISDPRIIEEIAPQRKMLGTTGLEPEAPIPGLDELQGRGYRLVPIDGPAGRGVTFDATLGELPIRRFTLVKVLENPTGLSRVELGGTGNGGIVALGDLHGTDNFSAVFSDINSGFKEPIIRGDPTNPDTWHAVASIDKGRTVVILGDSIDRGPAYETWRNTLNRLHDEAAVNGDRVSRLLGNHELAYLSDDAISGVEYTDAVRSVIKNGILDDIASGRLQGAVAADGKLFTHAGVSLGVFPEYAGKSADFIANDLNAKLAKASESGKFGDEMFAKGRTEKGHSLSTNEREQGGIFWLRPQEASAEQLNLGFEQVVGHNPGWGVRRIWGDNFIEADVSRRTGGTGAFVDTPFVSDKPVAITTKSLGGKAPVLSDATVSLLKAKAMRDTVADVFLGWDGRVKAVERIKQSTAATKRLVESIDRQIEERTAAGDSIGVEFLRRQKNELISPTGRDYLYGGIQFWRDIVMGRQNSVRILDGISTASPKQLLDGLAVVNATRERITTLSDSDVSRLFGTDKQDILTRLDTSSVDSSNRDAVAGRLTALRDIVDVGLDRSISSLLPQEQVVSKYSDNFQSELSSASFRPTEYRPVIGQREVPPERAPAPVERTIPPSETQPPVRVPEGRPPYVPPPALEKPPTTGYGPPPYPPQPPYPPPPSTPPPPYPPPPPPPPPPPDTGRPPLLRVEMPAEWQKTGVPRGTIEWRQGKKWVALPPPYKDENKLYLDNPLPGTYKFSTGKGSAYRTLQVINGMGAEDADIDMGWAQVHVRSKGRDLEMSFAGGQDAANERWAAEEAAMQEFERQAYANVPQQPIYERIPRIASRMPPQPFALNKTEIPEYSTDGLQVYSVNPAYIRSRYANQMIGDRKGVDWVSGGHEFVYWNLIPRGEIWVDNTLEPEDRDAVIAHEIEERAKMSKGMEYSEAHNDYANEVEIKARENPLEAKQMITEMIDKYHKEHPETTRRRRANATPATVNSNGIKDRYYLGRRLPSSSVGGV